MKPKHTTFVQCPGGCPGIDAWSVDAGENVPHFVSCETGAVVALKRALLARQPDLQARLKRRDETIRELRAQLSELSDAPERELRAQIVTLQMENASLSTRQAKLREGMIQAIREDERDRIARWLASRDCDEATVAAIKAGDHGPPEFRTRSTL